MNKYEVMSNGVKIEIEAEYYTIDQENVLTFHKNEQAKSYFASFKDWSYVRKI